MRFLRRQGVLAVCRRHTSSWARACCILTGTSASQGPTNRQTNRQTVLLWTSSSGRLRPLIRPCSIGSIIQVLYNKNIGSTNTNIAQQSILMTYISYFCECHTAAHRGIIVYQKEPKIRKEYPKDGANLILTGISIILSSFSEI